MAEYKQPTLVPTPSISYQTDPNNMNAMESGSNNIPARRVSMGDPGRNKVKTDGIKVRGTGAATRGVTARGPMA